MAVNKRNTRPSRRSSRDTNRFSERDRKTKRESQSLRYDAFDASNYGSGRSDDVSASAYSRRVSQGEYRAKRKKDKRKRTLTVALAIIAVLVVGGAGVAFAYYNTISGNLHRGLDGDLQDALVKTDLANEPFYLLLMGTDGSAEREADSGGEGELYRSDSIMLARIDPVDKKVTLVSIHRDTLVDMGEYGQQKLNAAHALGGAAMAVDVIGELAGVPISHYAEINFDGFKGIVDALGGVEVDVPMEIDDSDAGGYVAQGTQTLNGDQALILCRARHAYDDFGDGDSYRAANQRLVLAAIAKKVLSSDVGTIAGTVSAMSEYVTTDLEIPDIIGLAQTMRGLDPATDIYSGMEPTTSAYVGGVWYEYNNTPAWKTMMSRVDQGLPPTEEDIVDDVSGTVLASTGSGATSSGDSKHDTPSSDPSKNDKVVVKNGSGIDGVAAEAGDKLEEAGYTIDVGNADAYDYPETIVVYNYASQANEAKEIATTIGVGKAQLNNGGYTFDGDFLVVIGGDWE